MLKTLYARKETTTCAHTLAQPTPLGLNQRDVVVYRDAGAQEPVSRYPWYYVESKPTRRNRYIMHNCNRYRLEWLPDAA